MNDLLNALKQIEREMERIRPRWIVHVDDLLMILRTIRKLGYVVQRDPYRFFDGYPSRKRSIWFVKMNGAIIFEIYVDTTRTMSRGVMYKMPDLPKPHEPPPGTEFGFIRYFYKYPYR